ncbi:MAG: hypothetical protein KDA42_15215, partial [Planctomycetales bacterium]|nr:hypothetical protein [Planctomycetales bacterium]
TVTFTGTDDAGNQGTATAEITVTERSTATLDFGDAPVGFPIAQHTVGNLFLGDGVTAEFEGVPSATASSDSNDDGITLLATAIAASATPTRSSLAVVASAAGKLDAWIDFDGDGNWSPGEQIFADTPLVAGPNPLSFPVPADATPTDLTFTRFRFDSGGGLSPTGPAADGEVEDYNVEILGVDYGDAPDPTYPTLAASGGAAHVLGGGPFLGASVDPEPDGQPDPAAMGDDLDTLFFGPLDTPPPGDEDGVTFNSLLVPGLSATVDIVASDSGFLNAWVDFDGDGAWSSAEQIFNNFVLFPGLNAGLSFAVPGGADPGSTYARFRFDSGGSLTPTGLAMDGEVEDYEIDIIPDETPPEIEILSPADGTPFEAGGPIQVEIVALDLVDLGPVTVNGQPATPAGPDLFSVELIAPLSLEPFTILAQASDTSGNSASDQITVQLVDTTAPTVEIRQPAGGAPFEAGSPIQVEVLALDLFGLGEVTVNGQPVTPTEFDLFFAELVAPLAPGPFVIVAAATDTSGNGASSLIEVQIVDNTAPEIEIVSPAGGAPFEAGSPIQVEIVALDLVGLDVVLVNGQPADSTGENQFVALLEGPLEPGPFLITAEARDLSGNSAYAEVAVEIVPLPEPGELSIAPIELAKAEGDEGPTSFTFAVQRTGGSDGEVSVPWSVSGTTADAEDFGGELPSGVAVFPDGVNEPLVVELLVSGDLDVEPDETFLISLGEPTGGATLGVAAADGTILNDDEPVTIDPLLAATALSGLGHVALAWVPDATHPQTRVVRSDGGFPTNENDGTVVYEGAATSFIDDNGGAGLVRGIFYYAFFATDGLGNFSPPTYASDGATVVRPNGLSSILSSESESTIGALEFTDHDLDATLRATELGGALAVDLLGAASAGENDGLLISVVPQQAGTFTFETWITTPDVMNQDWNLELSLIDEGGLSIDFAFRYRYLFARAEGGPWREVARLLDPGTQHKLSVLFDTDSGDVTIYWDEGTSLYLFAEISNISQIALRNSGSATADLRYVLDDVSFTGGVPDFFTPRVSLPGVTAAELNDQVVLGSSERTAAFVGLSDDDQDGTMQGTLDSGELLLSLLGSATTNENDSLSVGLVSPISGLFTVEMEFTAPAVMNQEWNLQIGLEDGEENGTRMAFRFGYLFLRNNADTRWLQIKNRIAPGATHKLSIVVDTTAGTADYYIDNQLTARTGEATSLSQLRVVRFTNLGNAVSDLEYRIDNLRVVSGDVFNEPAAILGATDLTTNVAAALPAESTQSRRAPRAALVAAAMSEEDLFSMAHDADSDAALAIGRDRPDVSHEELTDELFSAIGREFE